MDSEVRLAGYESQSLHLIAAFYLSFLGYRFLIVKSEYSWKLP